MAARCISLYVPCRQVAIGLLFPKPDTAVQYREGRCETNHHRPQLTIRAYTLHRPSLVTTVGLLN